MNKERKCCGINKDGILGRDKPFAPLIFVRFTCRNMASSEGDGDRIMMSPLLLEPIIAFPMLKSSVK